MAFRKTVKDPQKRGKSAQESDGEVSAYHRCLGVAIDLRGEKAGRVPFRCYKDRSAANSGKLPYSLEQQETDIIMSGADVDTIASNTGLLAYVAELLGSLPPFNTMTKDSDGYVGEFESPQGDLIATAYHTPGLIECDMIEERLVVHVAVYASKALFEDGAPAYEAEYQIQMHERQELPGINSVLNEIDERGGRKELYKFAKTKDLYADAEDILEEGQE